MLGIGLGLHKSTMLLSNLKLFTRNADWGFWIDKATGTSKGTNSPQVNPIVDLVGVVGKNLFDPMLVDILTAGTTVIRLSNGITVSNSTSLAFARTAYKTTFTPNSVLTIKYLSTRTGSAGGGFTVHNNVGTYIAGNTDLLNGTFTFTVPSDGIVELRFYSTGGTAQIASATFTNIQLELGTTATAYEPYGKSNGLLQGFGFIPTSGYVDVVAPNGKTVTGIQGDGVNDVIVLPSNAPNPVGTQDFGFAFVFKTGAALPTGAIISRSSDASVGLTQYQILTTTDGQALFRLGGVSIGICATGSLLVNTFYKLIVYRKSGVLKAKLLNITTYDQPNITSIVTQPNARLFARSASTDGTTYSAFFNGIICYADYNNGTDTDAWEADQNKAIAKIYGL